MIDVTKDYSILVVDDEPNVCEFLVDFLTFNGYNALSAISGKEALQILSSQEIDLMLLDIIMPEMNGLEVLVRVKQEYPQTPVIILTGAKDQNIVAESLRLGAVDLIYKPIDLETLERSINTNLHH